MTATITHEQRDALYDQILDRLSGIEDVWLAASTGRHETADRLSREYSDELRLILDDLGWGDGPDVEMIGLKTASDVLRRVFGRLHDTVAEERAHRQVDWIENRELEERNRLVSEACESVLEALRTERPG